MTDNTVLIPCEALCCWFCRRRHSDSFILNAMVQTGIDRLRNHEPRTNDPRTHRRRFSVWAFTGPYDLIM